MVAIYSPKPQAKIYGLVRDQEGRPRVDGDPDKLPQLIKDMLTPEDWAYLKGND